MSDEQLWERIYGLYQDIRAESQNLRNLLLEIKDKTDENTIKTAQKIFQNNRDRISERLAATNILLEGHSSIYEWMGDTHANIVNFWERFINTVPDFTTFPQNKPEIIDECTGYLCEIVYYCDLVTIPHRTNHHLDSLKVGYGLDFYTYFEDEVCSREQAERILKYLGDHPVGLKGIVDSKQGLILKIDPPGKRWKSYLIIVLGAIFGGLATAILIAMLRPPEDISFIQNLTILVELYFVALLGSVAHIAIDALKEIRSPDRYRFKALDDIFLWIHVKELPILAGIGLLCLGFAGVIWISPVYNAFTFFIAGYSIDSLGDLFIQRFETTMATKGEELKKTISPS